MSTRRTPERVRAILVSLDIGPAREDDQAAEAARLVDSAGAAVVEVIRGRRDRPDAKTFAGSGKVEQIHVAAREHDADLVVFDQDLSAAQVRNLERELSKDGPEVRVVDRTDVILEIFSQRARTPARASCRSSSRASSGSPRAWCAAGPTWSGNVARPARPAARARSRSSSTAA